MTNGILYKKVIKRKLLDVLLVLLRNRKFISKQNDMHMQFKVLCFVNYITFPNLWKEIDFSVDASRGYPQIEQCFHIFKRSEI